MVGEDLHTGFGVRVVRWFVHETAERSADLPLHQPQFDRDLLCDTHLSEEHIHKLHETSKGQTVIGDDTLDLVELAQVCCINRLVSVKTGQYEGSVYTSQVFLPEDSVNGKVSGWWDTAVHPLQGQLVKHGSRDGSCVCSQHKSKSGLVRIQQ